MSPMRALRMGYWTCLSLLLACPVQAADSGRIEGEVLGPNGIALIDVRVVVTRAGTSIQRTTQTDESGRFCFCWVAPGDYDLTIAEPGFVEVPPTRIRVSSGGTSRLVIDMPLSNGEGPAAFVENRPVDPTMTGLVDTMDDSFLEAVPIFSGFQDAFQLASSLEGLAISPGQLALIDGFFASDPVTGQYAMDLPLRTISEIRLSSAGLAAGSGNTVGSAIRFELPAPADEYHLNVDLSTRPDLLGWKEKTGNVNETDDFHRLDLGISGPIVPGRLWFLIATGLDRGLSKANGYLNNYFDPYSSEPLDLPAQGLWRIRYLAKLTWLVDQRHELRLLVHGVPAWQDNIDQSVFIAPEAETKRFDDATLVGLGWRARWLDDLEQDTRFSVGLHRNYSMPVSGCISLDDPACRSHFDQDTGLITGNSTTDSRRHSLRLGLDSSLDWRMGELLGLHVLQAGAGCAYVHHLISEGLPGGGQYTDRSGRPYRVTLLAADQDGQLRKASSSIGYASLGLFLQDEWRILPNLIARPGVRLDLAWILNNEGERLKDFLNVNPRVNLAWDPLGDGKSAVRLGYNRYHADPGMKYIDSLLLVSFSTETWEYNPASGEYNIFVRRSGVSMDFQDERVRALALDVYPVDEMYLELERELWLGIRLSAAGLWRRQQIENTYESWGLQLSARRRFRSYWMVRATYAFNRWSIENDSTFSSVYDYPDPASDNTWLNQRKHDRHMLSFHGGVVLPLGIRFITALFFQESDYPAAVFDKPGFSLRGSPTDRLFLDFRVGWDLAELTSLGLELTLDLLLSIDRSDTDGLVTTDYPEGSPVQASGGGNRLWTSVGLRYRYF